MGLFSRWKNRKKKTAPETGQVSVSNVAASDEELAAVTAAAIAAAEADSGINAETLAVITAAVRAYEADFLSSFAGSPSQMELTAVISAAIAAYESGTTALPYIGSGPSGLYVRKINRMAGYAPAWGVMGNREAIDARRF